MSPRLHTWLVRALVFVGLSRSLIWLAGGKIVQAGLVQFLISPLPMVFDKVGFFSEVTVVVDSEQGRWEQVLDQQAVRRVRGPFNRRSMLTHTLTQGSSFPPELRDPIVGFLLCEPGVLIQALGGPRAQHAAFEMRAYRTDERDRLEQDCP